MAKRTKAKATKSDILMTIQFNNSNSYKLELVRHISLRCNQ